MQEDEEPQWYLLNCVAGLEIDLLSQCRQRCQDMEGVVKFVVPTEVKTRSHGANRMVTEKKVKYIGYVFAKLRLIKETYEAIQKMDLCRSWMGTINPKRGYRKLPPAPLPLTEEEIESFDLENPDWENEDVAKTPASNANERVEIIVDTEENEKKDLEAKAAVDDVVATVYQGLKVEDMIKVTAKNKFLNEDGIVRRLKDGKVLIRFFTYGTIYEEWLDPTDVRKLTTIEILKGLDPNAEVGSLKNVDIVKAIGGPRVPITQRDLDGPQQSQGERRTERDSRYESRFDGGGDRRNSVSSFGDGPRNRRQDSNVRRFDRNLQNDDSRERDNWNRYKENERHNQGGGYVDGDMEIRGSRSRDDTRRDNRDWAEGDANSQWGRTSPGQNRREKRQPQQNPDWSSFISQPPAPNNLKKAPSKRETDDFFESLMTDLSRDIDGNQRPGVDRSRDQSSNTYGAIASGSGDSDDDFFASLMAEISSDDEGSKSTSELTTRLSGDDDDDFFASMEREIRGATKPATQSKSPRTKLDAEEQVDDTFAELEAAANENTATSFGESDDFFASLEKELASEFGETKQESGWNSQSSKRTSHIDDLGEVLSPDESDDFFSTLESELRLDLEGPTTNGEAAFVSSTFPPIEEASTTDSFFSDVGPEGASPAGSMSVATSSTSEDARATTSMVPTKSPMKSAPSSSSETGNLQEHTVPKLKEMLRERGMKVTGKKADLIERLSGGT